MTERTCCVIQCSSQDPPALERPLQSMHVLRSSASRYKHFKVYKRWHLIKCLHFLTSSCVSPKVFEVNASSQRSGRLILSQLKEATQSHQVDSQGVNAHKPTYFNSYGTSSSAGTLRPGSSPSMYIIAQIWFLHSKYYKLSTNRCKFIVFFVFQERSTLLVGWFPLPGNLPSPQEVLKEEAWLPHRWPTSSKWVDPPARRHLTPWRMNKQVNPHFMW